MKQLGSNMIYRYRQLRRGGGIFLSLTRGVGTQAYGAVTKSVVYEKSGSVVRHYCFKSSVQREQGGHAPKCPAGW